MSIRVYLRGEIMDQVGFSKSPVGCLTFRKVRISEDRFGIYYVELSTTDILPDFLDCFVKGVTLSEQFTVIRDAYREAGVYRHETAFAELTCSQKENQWHSAVFIRGESLTDVLALFHLIRTGKIRPPESYEGSQNGLSRVELEKELREANDNLDGCQAVISELEEELKVAKDVADDSPRLTKSLPIDLF